MNKVALAMVAAAVIAVTMLWLMYHRSSASQMAAPGFRDLVLSHLRAEFPSRSFRASPGDPSSVFVDGFKLGLDNLRRKYEQSDRSEKALKELVRNQMLLVTGETGGGLRFPSTFEEARDRLLPQIMPPAIAADTNQVRFPFGGGLFIGIVADQDRAYMYLTGDTIGKWGTPKENIYRIAVENLDSRSKGLKLEAFKKGDTSFVAVGGDDGYAAARIMLPGLRKLLGEKLGFPFNFGVPNRDFLICWSAPGDEGSREFVTGRLKADFEQQPYPISASVFQMAADGTITEEVQAQQGASPNAAPPHR
jgi:hypothetical protein